MVGLVWSFQIPVIDELALRYIEYKYAVDLSYMIAGERGSSPFTLSYSIGPDWQVPYFELTMTVSRQTNKEPNDLVFHLSKDTGLIAALAGRDNGTLQMLAMPITGSRTLKSGDYTFRVDSTRSTIERVDVVRNWISGIVQYKEASEPARFTLDRRIDIDGFPLTSDVTISYRGGAFVQLSLTRLSKQRKQKPSANSLASNGK